MRDSLENSYLAQQPQVEKRAAELYNTDVAKAIKYLNDYSNEQAQSMLKNWKELATFLIVKYNDMAVKPTEGRSFKRNKEGLGAKVQRPGYPEAFARKLVKETGDWYVVPEEKKK